MLIESSSFSKAAHFVISLRDTETGGFAFAKGNKPTLMATAYAIHALEFLNALELLSTKEKSAAVGFMMRGSREDGSFRDPLSSGRAEQPRRRKSSTTQKRDPLPSLKFRPSHPRSVFQYHRCLHRPGSG